MSVKRPYVLTKLAKDGKLMFFIKNPDWWYSFKENDNTNLATYQDDAKMQETKYFEAKKDEGYYISSKTFKGAKNVVEYYEYLSNRNQKNQKNKYIVAMQHIIINGKKFLMAKPLIERKGMWVKIKEEDKKKEENRETYEEIYVGNKGTTYNDIHSFDYENTLQSRWYGFVSHKKDGVYLLNNALYMDYCFNPKKESNNRESQIKKSIGLKATFKEQERTFDCSGNEFQSNLPENFYGSYIKIENANGMTDLTNIPIQMITLKKCNIEKIFLNKKTTDIIFEGCELKQKATEQVLNSSTVKQITFREITNLEIKDIKTPTKSRINFEQCNNIIINDSYLKISGNFNMDSINKIEIKNTIIDFIIPQGRKNLYTNFSINGVNRWRQTNTQCIFKEGSNFKIINACGINIEEVQQMPRKIEIIPYINRNENNKNRNANAASLRWWRVGKNDEVKNNNNVCDIIIDISSYNDKEKERFFKKNAESNTKERNFEEVWKYFNNTLFEHSNDVEIKTIG